MISVIVPVILFFTFNLLFPLHVNIQYSKIITASDGTVLHAFLSSDEKWRMKTELSEITPLLKKTIIEKEDRYFYCHPGINPVSIIRALFNNLVHGKKTSGASTITMQVARMFDRKPRTYGNKIIEMFRALQLELHYSKDEILQLYLNLVPYSGNIEGVKSAALIYFGQTPDYLSLAQIVTLAIIPNRPSSLVLGKNNELIVQERNRWLKKFDSAKLFPHEEIEDALSENLSAKRQAVPRLAPHISIRLAREFPSQAIIHSTIDRKKQEKVENLAFNYIRRIHSMNITNCAVMVLNNETGNVEAYIGSADFNNAEDRGQVDGVRAIRSPGSTLKPFLYALAFDKGIATPKSVITDVPANFSGYAPVNFDKKFRGTVTIEEALANSLNVPAVKTLDEIGVQQFVSALKLAGFSTVEKNEKQLGLSVILGGCGVKLEELVRLYSCFANEGKEINILFVQNENNLGVTPPELKKIERSVSDESSLSSFESTGSNVRAQVSPSGTRPIGYERGFSGAVISYASAFMTSQILTEHTRPDLPNNYESSMHLPKIAWKTGTSYGRRDAWSIGYNKQFTVGVWVGNFDGTGVPELTGAEIATPLLFDIFNSISYNSTSEWLKQPKDCDFRLVCSVSGKVPEDFCSDQVIDYYIPGISSTAKCDHEKEIFVSADSAISYCRNCLPQSGFKKKLYSNLQPELISFYEAENIPYQKIPEHNPACTRIYTANAPMITSPTAGLAYIFEKDGGTQLMLTCNADNEVKQVYWYINDQFYRAASVSDKVFFTPKEGEVKISCADDKGRNTDVKVKVFVLK
ncbi:MAG: penicillin-binding protein 1C [Chitinophagales bacterium]|nr:penicillin-binding protein 1C [Chitinophagales bacterium]